MRRLFWFLLFCGLAGCEFAYFPECDYECGFAGGEGADIATGGATTP